MIPEEVEDCVEIMPGRLYWVALDDITNGALTNAKVQAAHYFSTDDKFVYQPFCDDFGPLNLSMTCRYCSLLDIKMKDPTFADQLIVHHCANTPEKRANAAFLMGAYQVVVLSMSAEEAYEPFNHIKPPFKPFCDASTLCKGDWSFNVTILDCLRGLERGVKLGWLKLQKFDHERYEFFEKVENGDMNWIVPEKFLVFAEPSPKTPDDDGYPAWQPEDYVPIFLNAGIRLVVRVNEARYDKQRFVKRGIRHADFYIAHGCCPSRELIDKFLHVTECESGSVAVHCQNGLSRTPILIGLYAMKHYGFPARAFIGWCKLCRPGSFIGRTQQAILCEMQTSMFALSPNCTWVDGTYEHYTFTEEGSIGININWGKKPPEIEIVKDGSMAGKQGLCEGDVLLEINGGEVVGLDWTEKEKLKKVIMESRPLSLKVRHKPVAIWGGVSVLGIQAIAADDQIKEDVVATSVSRSLVPQIVKAQEREVASMFLSMKKCKTLEMGEIARKEATTQNGMASRPRFHALDGYALENGDPKGRNASSLVSGAATIALQWLRSWM